MLIMYQWDQDG